MLKEARRLSKRSILRLMDVVELWLATSSERGMVVDSPAVCEETSESLIAVFMF